MCPMNDEQFLSALSAQEVEIELSKADEQDARTMTSWRLRKRHLMRANSNLYRYHCYHLSHRPNHWIVHDNGYRLEKIGEHA